MIYHSEAVTEIFSLAKIQVSNYYRAGALLFTGCGLTPSDVR